MELHSFVDWGQHCGRTFASFLQVKYGGSRIYQTLVITYQTTWPNDLEKVSTICVPCCSFTYSLSLTPAATGQWSVSQSAPSKIGHQLYLNAISYLPWSNKSYAFPSGEVQIHLQMFQCRGIRLLTTILLYGKDYKSNHQPSQFDINSHFLESENIFSSMRCIKFS